MGIVLFAGQAEIGTKTINQAININQFDQYREDATGGKWPEDRKSHEHTIGEHLASKYFDT